jgi:hypothetical protein
MRWRTSFCGLLLLILVGVVFSLWRGARLRVDDRPPIYLSRERAKALAASLLIYADNGGVIPVFEGGSSYLVQLHEMDLGDLGFVFPSFLAETRSELLCDWWGNPVKASISRELRSSDCRASPLVEERLHIRKAELRVWSSGPNGLDEGGCGDDLTVGPVPIKEAWLSISCSRDAGLL